MHKYEVKYVIFHHNMYVIKKFISGKSIFHVLVSLFFRRQLYLLAIQCGKAPTHTHTGTDRQTRPHTHTLTQQWQQ